jgi:hypothetical protein
LIQDTEGKNQILEKKINHMKHKYDKLKKSYMQLVEVYCENKDRKEDITTKILTLVTQMKVT